MSDKLDFDALKASDSLPSAKGAALSIMRQLKQEDISLPELAQTIQSDPALTGQIIKLANAVNPNKRRPIASVTTDTLLIVGINAIREVVIGLSLVKTYQKGGCSAFDYPSFWSHSAAMACATQKIGAIVRIAPAAELFTFGLLTEIGQLALATARPDAYSILLEQYKGQPLDTLVQAEIHQFGLGRYALTAAMTADWGMPQIFVDAMTFYTDTAASGFAPNSRQLNLILALRLATKMADIYSAATKEARTAIMPELVEAAAKLELDAKQAITIANQAIGDWREWNRLLHIGAKSIDILEMPDDFK